MARRLQHFLASDGLQLRRTGPSVAVALFGKHPAEAGFFELGLSKGSSLEDAYGWLFLDGITSNYDSWKAIPSDRRLDFNHPFLWVRGDRWIAGWMTESRDSAGAGGYPLVLCAEFHQVDLHRALGSVFAWLDECRQALMAAPSLVRIKDIFKARQERLQEVISRFPLEKRGTQPSAATKEGLLRFPCLGEGNAGLQRLIGIVDSDLNSMMAGRPWYSVDVPLPSYRVPGLADVGPSLSAWAHWFGCQLGGDLPVLLVQALPSGHVDVFLGQPGEAALSVLRRDPTAFGLTTDRPREVDSRMVARWESVRDEFLGKDRKTGSESESRTEAIQKPRLRPVIWSASLAAVALVLVSVPTALRLLKPAHKLQDQLGLFDSALSQVPQGLEDGERAMARLDQQLSAIAQDPAWKDGVASAVTNQWQVLRGRYGQWTNGLAGRRQSVATAETQLRQLTNTLLVTREQITRAGSDLTNVLQNLGKDAALLTRTKDGVIGALVSAQDALAGVEERRKKIEEQAAPLISQSESLIGLNGNADTNLLTELANKIHAANESARKEGMVDLGKKLQECSGRLSAAISAVSAASRIKADHQKLQDRFKALTEISPVEDWKDLNEKAKALIQEADRAGVRDLSGSVSKLQNQIAAGSKRAEQVTSIQRRLSSLEERLGPGQPALSRTNQRSCRVDLSELSAELDSLRVVALNSRIGKVDSVLKGFERHSSAVDEIDQRLQQLKVEIEVARTNATVRPVLRRELDQLGEKSLSLSDRDLASRVEDFQKLLASFPNPVGATANNGTGAIDGGGLTGQAQASATIDPEGLAFGPFGLPFLEMRAQGKMLRVGASEVTRGEFRRVMGKLPDKWVESADVKFTGPVTGTEDRYPVTFVSPPEAEEFCRRLAAGPEAGMAGRQWRYRLPTWEEHRELRGEKEAAPSPNLSRGKDGLRERPLSLTYLVDAWGNAGELASKDGGWVVVGASFKDREAAIRTMTADPPLAMDPPVLTQGFRVVAEPLP